MKRYLFIHDSDILSFLLRWGWRSCTGLTLATVGDRAFEQIVAACLIEPSSNRQVLPFPGRPGTGRGQHHDLVSIPGGLYVVCRVVVVVSWLVGGL